MAPLSVDKVVQVSHKCKIPPFSHKVIHGSVGLVLQGYRMNVMTHGLEKRSLLLPLGVDVQSAYTTLATGSNRVTVVLRNNTRDWLEIRKGTLVTRSLIEYESEKFPQGLRQGQKIVIGLKPSTKDHWNVTSDLVLPLILEDCRQ